VRRVLYVLPVSLVVVLLAAAPALAADEPEFTGTFMGLAYAAIAGVVLGAVYFFSLPSGPSRDEHDAHH
jgi:hypothetical protein